MKDEDSKDVYGQMDEIAGDMERLFYHLFCPKDPVKALATRKWHPLTDIIETDDIILIKIELAGLDKKDININIDRNRLVVTGCRKEIIPPAVKSYHQMEINYGEFERILPLKPGTDKSMIDAKFGKGFLTITIDTRKKAKAGRTKQVNVKDGGKSNA